MLLVNASIIEPNLQGVPQRVSLQAQNSLFPCSPSGSHILTDEDLLLISSELDEGVVGLIPVFQIGTLEESNFKGSSRDSSVLRTAILEGACQKEFNLL